MRSTSRRWTCACSAAWACSLRATTSRPLVPLSSRWTMPGRSGSAPPPSRSPSSSTRVGPLCEGPGGVAGEDVADERQRQSGDKDKAGAAAAGEAEGDAAVVREGEFERPEHLDLLAGDEVRLDRRLRRLIEDDDEPAERAGQAPG